MDLLLMEKTLLALFFAAAIAVAISKLRRKRFKLPPGPIPVPFFGNWLQVGHNLKHNQLPELAKKYGDIFMFRIGQRNIGVISSPELAKEVLQTQGVDFSYRIRNAAFDIFTGNGQDLIFTDGDHWRKMRRVMTVPFFNNKAVQKYSRCWEEEAASMVEDIKKSYPQAMTTGICMRTRLKLLTHNNMFRMLFDKRFEGEDDPLFLDLQELNLKRDVLAQSHRYNYGDFNPILRPLLRGYLNTCKETCEKRLRIFDHFIQNRKKLITSTNDQEKLVFAGIDHILEAQQMGVINEDNVRYIVDNMNNAGIDTIVRSLEWAIVHLVDQPEVQRKLQHELDTVLGPGIQLTEPDTHKLPYLEAVLKEVLRLRMAAPLLVPHTNANDAKVGPYDIPAGSRITVNAWWLANNPAHWKNPEVFRPERFLEEESHVNVNGNDFRYIPFGVGRRSCPGMVLALPMLRVTLGRLVQNFDLLVPPGQVKVDTSEDDEQFSLRLLNPLKIVFKPRSTL